MAVAPAGQHALVRSAEGRGAADLDLVGKCAGAGSRLLVLGLACCCGGALPRFSCGSRAYCCASLGFALRLAQVFAALKAFKSLP